MQNDNEANGKRTNSGNAKRLKVDAVESQSTNVVSLKTILEMPGLSKAMQKALAGDVRPLNEQRDPALFIRICCNFDGDDADAEVSTEHLIKIQWSKPSYIITPNITDPTPSAYTTNEPLEKIILDILSLKQQFAEIQLKEWEEDDDVYFNVSVKFLFSELLAENMRPSGKEEISRSLEVLHSFNVEFKPYDVITFGDGRRKPYWRSERYKEGHFFQHEIEFSRRIFSAMHYREMKYYDGCSNSYVNIEPMLDNIVTTFKKLTNGSIRLQPQELPPSMWEEKKGGLV